MLTRDSQGRYPIDKLDSAENPTNPQVVAVGAGAVVIAVVIVFVVALIVAVVNLLQVLLLQLSLSSV